MVVSLTTRFVSSVQSFDKGQGNAFSPLSVYGHYGVNYPLTVPNSTVLGLGKDDLTRLAILQLSESAC